MTPYGLMVKGKRNKDFYYVDDSINENFSVENIVMMLEGWQCKKGDLIFKIA